MIGPIRLGFTVMLAVGILGVAGCSSDGQATPTPTDAGAPTPSASASLMPSLAAGSGTPSSTARASAAATAVPSGATGMDALPSRVVVPDLGIDLPVVSGDLVMRGNPPDYPLCNVAQYLTTYRYPARPGTTTWIYGHAREGLLLPLLQASERNEGKELVGVRVHLYSDAGRRYTYRITEVIRHATDRGIARDIPEDGRRLVLQTSEGPKGTVPKLQIAADLVGEEGPVAAIEAKPSASPTVCYIP